MALPMANAPPGGSSGLGTDWQLGCSELKQRGGHLLQTGQWADCSFIVGAEPHQITFKAHKLILASASPVFEAMFFGGMAEGDGPIKILDVQPTAFKILLLYIYTDKTIISSFDGACSIYYAAKKYMLPYLVKECTWFISLNVDAQTVCRAYELAELFDEDLLVEKCLKVMEGKTKEIVTEDSFLEADMKTVNTLLSLEHLNIESELDLFNALDRYAKVHLKSGQYKRRREENLSCSECSIKRAKLRDSQILPLNCSTNTIEMNSVLSDNGANCNKTDNRMERHEETGELMPKVPKSPSYSCGQTDVTGDDALFSEDDERNVSMSSQDSVGTIDRACVRAAVAKIRFLTLTAPQFASGPARSPLLSESEAFAVLMNILSSNSDVPMPHGFSTSRLIRNQQNIAPEMCESKSEAVFRFTVLNFKTRRRSVESRPFLLHDKPWTLRLVPRVDSDTAGRELKYYGLYLKCVAKDVKFACRVRADIQLLSQSDILPVSVQLNKVFTNAEAEGGIERFVSWNALLDPSLGLLRNNAVTLEARLTADLP